MCNGKRNTHRVHRLVLLTFVGASPLEVNHRDGCKQNNELTNLEYCTRSDNMRHAVRTGLWKCENANTKLTHQDIHAIRCLHAEGWTEKNLGVRFGVTQQNISRVLTGKSWSRVVAA